MKLSDVLGRWRENPVQFVEEALGVDSMASWQRDVLEAIPKHDYLAIRSGHGVGKSTLVSWITLWRLICFSKAKTLITANTQPQLRDVISTEIRSWSGALPAGLKDMLDLSSERGARGQDPENNFYALRTASKEVPESLQGFHSDHLTIIVDEASGVADPIYELLEGTMTGEDQKMILVGNPTRINNYFYHCFHKWRSDWWTRKVSSLEVTGEGHKWAEGAKRVAERYEGRYGADSSTYKIRILGEFSDQDDQAVIPLRWVEDAVTRTVDPTGDTIWGVDVARYGDDRSALAKRKGNVLLEPIRSWKGKNTAQTADIIAGEWDRTPVHERPVWICVDVIGIGSGVVDFLRRDGFPVKAVNVAEKALRDKEFVRRRDELWWLGREWFEEQDCHIPEDDQLIEELTAPIYEHDARIQVEKKKDIKLRVGKSPDLADAFLATFAARSRPSKRKTGFTSRQMNRKMPTVKFRGREMGYLP